MSYLRRSHRLLLLASATFCFAQAALAQDTAPGTDQGDAASIKTVKNDDGSIIVTARHYVPDGTITANKTNIPLIETPQSISVITRDQIDLLNFIDIQQAVRYTSGAFGENYGADPRYDFVTVRGFTPKQYIDGLAVPATSTIASTGVDLYAFQSLDILKGPSSALYGSAPPGGILNETSRRASSDFGGEIQGKYGTHGFGEAAMTVTGPAAPYLDVRMTALYRNAGSEVDHTNRKRILAAPTATLKLGPDTKLTGLAYYQYDKVEGGAGGFLPIYGTLLPNPNGKIGRSTNLDDPNDLFERRQYGLGYDFEHRFGNAITFHSNTKWSHYKEETPIGLYSGAGFINITDPSLPSYYRTVGRYNFSYEEQVNSFTTDNRIDANFNTGSIEHKLLVGVDYRNVRNVARYGFAGGGTLDAFDPVYDPQYALDIGFPSPYASQRLRQTGAYAQDQLKFGDLFVMLSGRYDWVKADGASFVKPQKNHKFTYRVGVNYVTASGIAPYVSYATSFEPVLGVDMNGNPYKPTSTKQWEGGIKYDARGLPQGFKLFATVAVFDLKQTNFVSAQTGLLPVGGSQGGNVEVYGAEFEVVSRINDQLTLNASYSYNHSEVKSSAQYPHDVGFPMPTTPKNKISLFADYTTQKGFLAGLGGGFGVRHNSKSAGNLPSGTGSPFPDTMPVFYAGKVTLFDAILHYDLPGWRFAVNGSNIFDKKYIARCASMINCVYGQARQVIGTVTMKF